MVKHSWIKERSLRAKKFVQGEVVETPTLLQVISVFVGVWHCHYINEPITYWSSNK